MADISGSRSGRYKRPSDIWLYVIDGAASEKDVVTAARDFLATLSPVEISRLNECCRPGKINDGEDISDLAYRLSQEHLVFTGSLNDRIMLERIMAFFVHAGARIAELRGRMAAAGQRTDTSH